MGLSDCLIQMLRGLLVYAVWPPNKVVKALREDMYKQTIPAPYVAGTRAKSVNFTDGVGLSSSRRQNSAKNLVNLTLALWCGKTTTSLMPCQYTSPALSRNEIFIHSTMRFNHGLDIRENLVITWPYIDRPSAPQVYQCKITQSTGMATQMQLKVLFGRKSHGRPDF